MESLKLIHVFFFASAFGLNAVFSTQDYAKVKSHYSKFTEGEQIPFLKDKGIQINNLSSLRLINCLLFCVTDVHCAGVRFTDGGRCFMMTRDSTSQTGKYTVKANEIVYRKG